LEEPPVEKVFVAEVSGDALNSGFLDPPLTKESEVKSRVSRVYAGP
jgi:hypothetical protein